MRWGTDGVQVSVQAVKAKMDSVRNHKHEIECAVVGRMSPADAHAGGNRTSFHSSIKINATKLNLESWISASESS